MTCATGVAAGEKRGKMVRLYTCVRKKIYSRSNAQVIFRAIAIDISSRSLGFRGIPDFVTYTQARRPCLVVTFTDSSSGLDELAR